MFRRIIHKQIVLTLLVLLFFSTGKGQTTLVKKVHSEFLNEDRTIRIQLPKSYERNPLQQYPLVLCLDGEYLFYAVTGNTEMLSPAFADKMPEVLVVGIDQNYPAENERYARWIDCNYGESTGMPIEKGIAFKQFIEKELLPLLEKKYRAGKFRLIAGHSFTANYIHYFLIQNPGIFKAYIALSPYIPEAAVDTLVHSMQKSSNPLSYFLCTSEFDLRGHRNNIRNLDTTAFQPVKNPNFRYMYRNYRDETHLSLVARALPEALRFVFSGYAPIEEVPEPVLCSADSLLDYLKQKYAVIHELYGIELQYREEDLLSISGLIEELEAWDQLKILGELSISALPESCYGYYMLGTVEEKRGNLEKALAYYKTGFSKLSAGVLNKADFYLDIERVEKLINQK